MQSALSNDKSLGMVPHIENPALYRHFFNLYHANSKSPFIILQGERSSARVEEGVESLKEQNRTEIDGGQIITQIGSGEVQLISPSQATVERAREGLKSDNKRKKRVKKIHSLIGLGKGKSKSKKQGKKSAKKSANSSSKRKTKGKAKSKKGKKNVKKRPKKGKKK